MEAIKVLALFFALISSIISLSNAALAASGKLNGTKLAPEVAAAASWTLFYALS